MLGLARDAGHEITQWISATATASCGMELRASVMASATNGSGGIRKRVAILLKKLTPKTAAANRS